MSTGKVKFFNHEKGFGFIVPEGEDGKDIFFHISEVKNGQVEESDTVSYEVGEGKKGPCALNVVPKN